jgi:hypothetical protein
MNNFRYKIARLVELQINIKQWDYERANGAKEAKNNWVQMPQDMSPPHQFPLNADGINEAYPVLPISMNWIKEQLDRTHRYNGNSGGKPISVLRHTIRGLAVLDNIRPTLDTEFFREKVLDIIMLNFMFHDFEEAIIGDVISPLEKALGLDLRAYKDFIRCKVINRVLLGLPHTYSNIEYKKLVHLSLLMYSNVINMKEFWARAKDGEMLEFCEYHDHELGQSIDDIVNKIDHACFVYEAKEFATLPHETWYCESVDDTVFFQSIDYLFQNTNFHNYPAQPYWMERILDMNCKNTEEK